MKILLKSSIRFFDLIDKFIHQKKIYNFFLKENINIKSFIDVGSDRFNILGENFLGYGIGLSQINEESILKIEYALSSTSRDAGKLHVKLISRL